MIRSGIVPIDETLGGFRPQSAYLLTGGAGSGKTTCALRFADAGLRAGERVAMLVHEPREALFAHAGQLGIELTSSLRDGRLLLLRYRADFARRLSRAASAEDALDDLRRQILGHRPQRLVIDSFAPLLEDGSSSPMPAASIAELLELSRCTSLLTYPGELSDGYDRRLEPLVHAATGVLRLVRNGHGEHIDVITLRDASPPAFSLGSAGRLTAGAVRDETLVTGGGPLLLLHVTSEPSDDLLAALRLQHDVIVRAGADGDGAAALDGVVIETDHATLEHARAVIRARQSAGETSPIVVATRFTLRSLDRARLLRDGADEVLAGEMGIPELLQRLAAAIRRGHLARPPLAVHEDEGLTQTALALPGELLDRERFAEALRVRTGHDDAVPFTILRLTTEPAGIDELRALGALVLAGMRAGTGDLAALLDDAIAVYLHGARHRDVAPFLDRLRGRREPHAPALRVASACYPAESAAMRQLVAPLEVR
jgi:KaiC/GvpD/RAD55 family RecA-like ATPase